MLSVGKQLAARAFSALLRFESARLFIALVVCLASSAPAFEVTESLTPSQSHDSTADFIQQLDGLESVLVSAHAVETAIKERQESALLLAAREASEKASGGKEASNFSNAPESRPAGNAWATVVPTKSSAGGNSGGEVSNNPSVQALADKPSTSTLSFGDFGPKSKSSLLSDLRGGAGGGLTGGKLPSLLLGAVGGVGPNGKDAGAKKPAPEKKEDSGSKVDPTGASNIAKFGKIDGDLTMGNIAKNNKQSEKDQSVKEMVEKALNNKDKNKEKEEEKKKEEKAKVEKKIGELVEKDPFKYEDYEALRDLYNEQVKNNGEAAAEMFAGNPKLDGLKDKIVNEFAPRDGAKPEVKDPLLTFLSDKEDRKERFQSPIVVDPTEQRHLGLPVHSGSK